MPIRSPLAAPVVSGLMLAGLAHGGILIESGTLIVEDNTSMFYDEPISAAPVELLSNVVWVQFSSTEADPFRIEGGVLLRVQQAITAGIEEWSYGFFSVTMQVSVTGGVSSRSFI